MNIEELKIKIKKLKAELDCPELHEEYTSLKAQLKQSKDILRKLDKMRKTFKSRGEYDEDDMNTYHTLTEFKQKITGKKPTDITGGVKE